MDELITKKQAVERMNDLMVLELKMTRPPTWNEVYNAIQELPSAHQWILCSDRLPELNQKVFVSTVWGLVRDAEYKGFDAENKPMWLCHGVVFWEDEVLCWIPMPEPYKGDEDDSD